MGLLKRYIGRMENEDIALLIADMVRAGVDAELVGRAAAAFAGRQAIVVREEPARSSHAMRQARYRERHKASQSVTRDVTSDGSDAYTSLPSKEGPHTPKETQPTLPTTHKENPPKGGQKKASRLPSTWVLPDDWAAEAVSLGVSWDQVDIEAAKMRDWSLSSKNGAKFDWRATWRNWCRDAATKGRPRAGPPPKRTLDDVANDLIAKMDRANADTTAEDQGYSAAPLRLSAAAW